MIKDVLRRLCSDGFPTNNYFDLCAYYLLEYETIIKNKEIRDKPLKDLVEESNFKEKEIEEKQNASNKRYNIKTELENKKNSFVIELKNNVHTDELDKASKNLKDATTKNRVNKLLIFSDKFKIKRICY